MCITCVDQNWFQRTHAAHYSENMWMVVGKETDSAGYVREKKSLKKKM